MSLFTFLMMHIQSNILKLHSQGLSGVCQKTHSYVFSADDQFLKTNMND